MRDLAGRTAFVTGAASGIGFALAHAFSDAGMQVVLADIEADALSAALATFDRQTAVRGVVCDVANLASVERAADAAFAAFGNVHVVCNNAGVGGGSGADDISVETWRWVLDVNLMGVLHGIKAFLPHIRTHGEGGHIVNTASMAGLQSGIGFSPYVTSKYGVVAMSEGLAAELKPVGIGVTVVCPGFVRTRIAESARNRPGRYGPYRKPDPGSRAGELAVHLADRADAGQDPRIVAARVLDAIRADELYVFTHPEMREEIDARFAAIRAALDKAALDTAARR